MAFELLTTYLFKQESVKTTNVNPYQTTLIVEDSSQGNYGKPLILAVFCKYLEHKIFRNKSDVQQNCGDLPQKIVLFLDFQSGSLDTSAPIPHIVKMAKENGHLIMFDGLKSVESPQIEFSKEFITSEKVEIFFKTVNDIFSTSNLSNESSQITDIFINSFELPIIQDANLSMDFLQQLIDFSIDKPISLYLMVDKCMVNSKVYTDLLQYFALNITIQSLSYELSSYQYTLCSFSNRPNKKPQLTTELVIVDYKVGNSSKDQTSSPFQIRFKEERKDNLQIQSTTNKQKGKVTKKILDKTITTPQQQTKDLMTKSLDSSGDGNDIRRLQMLQATLPFKLFPESREERMARETVHKKGLPHHIVRLEQPSDNMYENAHLYTQLQHEEHFEVDEDIDEDEPLDEPHIDEYGF